MAREYTNKLLDMLDEGSVSKDYVILACLKYMSEAEVHDMMLHNDILVESDEDIEGNCNCETCDCVINNKNT